MADPLTLTAVSAVVLTEGIKFLYGQAGDVIKRWRDRKEKETKSEPVVVQAPAVLEGRLSPVVIEFDRAQELEGQLRPLRQGLVDYVEGIDQVDMTNHDLLVRVDALRRLLEAIYGQRITFKGEARPASGTPVVVGITDVKTIAGKAMGVSAETIVSGDVRGEVHSDRVEAGGEATAVRVGRIGGGQDR